MSNYESQAAQLQKEFGTFKNNTQNDDRYTEAYKAGAIKAEREKVSEKMAELRKAHQSERAAQLQSLVNSAFARRGSEVEYLTTMNAVDAMTRSQLTKFIDNAISINAEEALRAAGRVAYNSSDLDTLYRIRDNTSGDLSRSIDALLERLVSTKDVETRLKESITFSVP